jgi:hypothetical protein
MSNDVLVPVEVDEDLDDQVIKYRLQGMTAQQISRKMLISVPQVNAALDRALPKLDQHYRRRVISESLLICDKIIGQHMTSIADVESAGVLIRALCERRFWIGVNASSDPVQLVSSSMPENSTEAYKRALAAVRERKISRMVESFTRLANEGKPAAPDAPASGDADAPDKE